MALTAAEKQAREIWSELWRDIEQADSFEALASVADAVNGSVVLLTDYQRQTLRWLWGQMRRRLTRALDELEALSDAFVERACAPEREPAPRGAAGRGSRARALGGRLDRGLACGV